MVAHTISTFMRPISVEMRKPMPTIGVPKNSATMAPISARVELILRALKIKGSALGSRTLRSEEHTSELQSLMRISYAVFCLKKKKDRPHIQSLLDDYSNIN